MKVNFFSENYRLSWSFLKKIKWFIFFCLFLFAILSVSGYYFPSLFQEQITKIIEQLIKQTEGLNSFEMVLFILGNNIRSSFFSFIFGIGFIIVPLSTIIVNGFILGFAANKAVSSEGFIILWKLFPNGIFEIPAVMISVALGIRIGTFFIFIKNKTKGISVFFISLFIFLIFLSILSFIIASGNDFENISSIMQNPLNILIYGSIIVLFFLLSVFIGILILKKKERIELRKLFIKNLIESVRVFIFVLIPLLIIAGIIEGVLIRLLG